MTCRFSAGTACFPDVSRSGCKVAHDRRTPLRGQWASLSAFGQKATETMTIRHYVDFQDALFQGNMERLQSSICAMGLCHVPKFVRFPGANVSRVSCKDAAQHSGSSPAGTSNGKLLVSVWPFQMVLKCFEGSPNETQRKPTG